VAPDVPLTAPGQAQVVIVTRQEGGDVDMQWEAPITGGAVAGYRIEKRDLAEGAQWKIVWMSVITSATLTGQERGKEM
jgi:hypothetical protein